MDAEKRHGLRYIAEMGAATALCVGAVSLQNHLLPAAGDTSPWHTALLLLPIIPIWLMLLAVVRHYWRIDEYQRLKLLKIVALSAGIATALYPSYTFAAKAFALPPLTTGFTWPVMAVCWIAATLLTRARNAAQPA